MLMFLFSLTIVTWLETYFDTTCWKKEGNRGGIEGRMGVATFWKGPAIERQHFSIVNAATDAENLRSYISSLWVQVYKPRRGKIAELPFLGSLFTFYTLVNAGIRWQNNRNSSNCVLCLRTWNVRTSEATAIVTYVTVLTCVGCIVAGAAVMSRVPQQRSSSDHFHYTPSAQIRNIGRSIDDQQPNRYQRLAGEPLTNWL